MMMELSNLSTDTQIEVFSFLELDSLRRMMATSRGLRGLLASDAAYRLWLFQMELCWGKLPEDIILNDDDSSTSLVILRNDVEEFPFAMMASSTTTTTDATDAFERLGKTNLPLLLALKPEKIAKHLLLYFYRPGVVFDVSSRSNNRVLGGARLEYSSEFTNYVYSVRASHPLDKPKFDRLEILPSPQKDETIMEVDSISNSTTSSDGGGDSEAQAMIGSDAREKEVEYSYKWRPFVIPYRCQSNNGPAPCVINVSPRLVSYYEITIEAREWENPPYFRDDCVCIGLSTSRSRWISRLPGWDKLSYGYHGDNGGLYHGSGRNIGLVGVFGLGDTVGMGVDYVNRHIFVTKNGRFVTIAFHNLCEKMLSRTHLLPVVGLFTKHAVRVNYGGLAEPFRFNLASYCKHDQKQLDFSSNQVPVEIECSD